MTQGATDPIVAEEPEDPAEEALYQQAQHELRNPRPLQMTGLLFVILFLVFLAGQFEDLKSPLGLAVLVVVIAFHEAGHALGMRLFGFRDVRMFFIPFFGAAVSGRPRGAAAWKEAIVSLLGPVPGIFLGLALLFFARRQPTTLAVTAIQSLLFLNVFNLLPFGFLDGGQFIERIIFSRHRILHVGFLGLGSLLLGYLALKIELYLLAAVAAFSLIGLPQRWRVLNAAAVLRRQHPTFVPDPETLGEVEGRAIFGAARAIVPASAGEQPAAIARTMESVVDGMKRAPGALASLALLAVYAFTTVCGLIGIVWLAMETRSASWQVVEQAGWHADFPLEPSERREEVEGGVVRSWRVAVEGVERFTVEVHELKPGAAAGDAWMDESVQELGRETETLVVHSEPITVAGLPGREFELRAPRRFLRARLFTVANRRYRVSSSAPAPSENQRRFIESFRILEASAAP
jgi:Zn-dependent protease